MSDSKKVQEQELKKLEDEAYFELKQIIAEAMQLQDIELLDARIASWKNKYKKLLDRPSTSSKSDFKKRIEFLLNQYYTEITEYILNQLKLKEEKKIENQSKALRELYIIIKNTNDLDLLKSKVNKWEEKYPVSSFLRMYQKRIELYTREKNLRENAFKQEEAFRDLVDITKKYATLDELKEELELWEKKYSINDKFTIDDFIKHQSEVKRFTSNEFLQSIARDDLKPDTIDKNKIDLVKEGKNKSFSDLSVQASSYAALVAISKSHNNVNEMFRWVYKNSSVKFNDKYKELILRATYLDYSPAYLNKLQKPKIDISKNSISYEEYKNMEDIKRYAIISYFNLLLPPDKAVANDYFNRNIKLIVSKSEKAKFANNITKDSILIENVIDSGIKVPLPSSKKDISTDSSVPKEDIKTNILEEKPIKENKDESDEIKDILDFEFNVSENNEISQVNMQDTSLQDEFHNLPDNEKVINIDYNSEENEVDTAYKEPKTESLDSKYLDATKELTYVEPEQNDSTLDFDTDEETLSNDNPEFDYDTIVTLSPLFFSEINNYDKQAVLIDNIDSTVNKYVESQKQQSLEIDETIKTKNDSE